MTGKRIVVTVSDPWGFHEENQGISSFEGTVAFSKSDYFIIRLDKMAHLDGVDWPFVVPSQRLEGYEISGLITNQEMPANLHFFDDSVLRMNAHDLKEATQRAIGGAIGSIRFLS